MQAGAALTRARPPHPGCTPTPPPAPPSATPRRCAHCAHHVSERLAQARRVVGHEPLGEVGEGLVHQRKVGVTHQRNPLQHANRPNDERKVGRDPAWQEVAASVGRRSSAGLRHFFWQPACNRAVTWTGGTQPRVLPHH